MLSFYDLMHFFFYFLIFFFFVWLFGFLFNFIFLFRFIFRYVYVLSVRHLVVTQLLLMDKITGLVVLLNSKYLNNLHFSHLLGCGCPVLWSFLCGLSFWFLLLFLLFIDFRFFGKKWLLRFFFVLLYLRFYLLSYLLILCFVLLFYVGWRSVCRM